MAAVEEIVLRITADNKQAAEELKKTLSKLNIIEKQEKKVAKSSTSMFKKMKQNWLGITAAIGGTVIAIKKFVSLARTQIKVDTQLNAVLRSTGRSASWSAKEVKKLAAELQKQTGIGDEVIQVGQNMLLTFTNIGKKVFPDATKALVDMTYAMTNGNVTSESLRSTAIQLGKALNDPIRGVTALRRVGVQLSQTQEEQVRHFVEINDIASAQQIIINELKKEFGGSAEIKDFNGQLRYTSSVLSDAGEKIGSILLPYIVKLAGWVAKAATWFTNLNPRLQKMAIGIIGIAAAMKVLSVALTFLNFNPVVISLTAVLGLVAGLAFAIKKASDAIDTNIKLNKDYTKGLEKQVKENEESINRLKKYREEAKKAGRSTKEFDEQINKLTIANENLQKQIKEVKNKTKELEERNKKSTNTTKDLTKEMKKYTKELINNSKKMVENNEIRKSSITDYYNFVKDKYNLDLRNYQESLDKAESALSDSLGIRKDLIDDYVKSNTDIDADLLKEQLNLTDEQLSMLTDMRANYQTHIEQMEQEHLQRMQDINNIAISQYSVGWNQLSATQKQAVMETYNDAIKRQNELKNIINNSITSVTSSYADGIINMLVYGEKFKKNMGDFIKDIIAEFSKLIIKMLIAKSIMAAFNMATGGGGSILSFLSEGGLVKAKGYKKGGVVYAAEGTIFEPKGTDTIPAMLTPGERVLSVKQNRIFENFVKTFANIPLSSGYYYANGGVVSGNSGNNVVINNEYHIQGEVIDEIAFKDFTKKIMNEQERILQTGEAY